MSWFLKNLFLTVNTLGNYGGPESTDFKQLILWMGVVFLKELLLIVSTSEGVVVLKQLIFNSFHFGKVWWS